MFENSVSDLKTHSRLRRIRGIVMGRNFINKFLGRFAIRYKIIIAILPFAILSNMIIIASIAFLSFSQMKSIVRQQFEQQIIDKQVSVDNYLEDIDTAVTAILYNSRIQSLLMNLKEDMDPELYQSGKEEIVQKIRNSDTLTSRQNVLRIFMKNENGVVISDSALMASSKKYMENLLAMVNEPAQELHGRAALNYQKSETPSILFSRMVYENKLNNPNHEIALCVVELNRNSIKSMLADNNLKMDVSYMLVDQNKDIVLNTTGLTDEICKEFISGNPVKVQNKQYHPIIKELSFGGFQVIGVMNETSIYKNVNQTLYSQILWIILSILILLSAIILVSAVLSDQFARFIDVLKSTKRLGDGDYLNAETQDEFGELAHVYNDMVNRISSLEDTIDAKELLAQNAELKAFQAQINPHFIYNTLDCINGLADLNEPEKVKMTINNLASILRMTIKDAEMQSVKRCMDYLNRYIYIQKMRVQGRILFLVEVDEEIDSCEIPKLVLQPLVENAIVHGLADRMEQGMIAVTGTHTESDLIFKVKDNGAGFSEEMIERINTFTFEKENDSIESDSVGIRNIQIRLSLVYGREDAVRVKNLKNGGSMVTVTIPKRYAETYPEPV